MSSKIADGTTEGSHDLRPLQAQRRRGVLLDVGDVLRVDLKGDHLRALDTHLLGRDTSWHADGAGCVTS